MTRDSHLVLCSMMHALFVLYIVSCGIAFPFVSVVHSLEISFFMSESVMIRASSWLAVSQSSTVLWILCMYTGL